MEGGGFSYSMSLAQKKLVMLALGLLFTWLEWLVHLFFTFFVF